MDNKKTKSSTPAIVSIPALTSTIPTTDNIFELKPDLNKEDLISRIKSLKELTAQALEDYINSLNEVVSRGLKIKVSGFTYNRTWNSDTTKEAWELRSNLHTQNTKESGTFYLSLSPVDVILNYSTGGSQSLIHDKDFIEKNLLIAALTLEAENLENFLDDVNVITLEETLAQYYKLLADEQKIKFQAEKQAKEAENQKKLADKKAKAAARRKARREKKIPAPQE